MNLTDVENFSATALFFSLRDFFAPIQQPNCVAPVCPWKHFSESLSSFFLNRSDASGRLNALEQIDDGSDDDDDDDAGRGGGCELYDRFAAAFYCRCLCV